MIHYSISPREMFASVWRNHSLIINLTKRDIVSRYKGSVFGLLWSFFNPIFMLVVYTFVFSIIFKARWGHSNGSKSEFALILFAGLIIFNFFAECFNRSPLSVISNTNYVKKIVFPLEILAWVNICSSLFNTVVSVIVWMIFYVALIGWPHYTLIIFPVVLVPILFFTLGLSWILMSIGVYLRDIAQVVGLLTTILMFLSPIFYPIDSLPKEYQPLLNMNPLAPAIAQMRDVLYWGLMPNWTEYIIYLVISMVISFVGFIWFQKTRKGFSDVL